MIVDSRALSIEQAIAVAENRPINLHPDAMSGDNAIRPHDTIVLISITDSSMPKPFKDADNICAVEFADIEPMNAGFEPPECSEYMTDAHATKVLEFIKRWHEKPEKVLLLVHCRHGMCRSGAIVDFAGMICGLGYWNTRRRNPQIVPNHWVQYQLYKAWFKNKMNGVSA